MSFSCMMGVKNTWLCSFFLKLLSNSGGTERLHHFSLIHSLYLISSSLQISDSINISLQMTFFSSFPPVCFLRDPSLHLLLSPSSAPSEPIAVFHPLPSFATFSCLTQKACIHKTTSCTKAAEKNIKRRTPRREAWLRNARAPKRATRVRCVPKLRREPAHLTGEGDHTFSIRGTLPLSHAQLVIHKCSNSKVRKKNDSSVYPYEPIICLPFFLGGGGDCGRKVVKRGF